MQSSIVTAKKMEVLKSLLSDIECSVKEKMNLAEVNTIGFRKELAKKSSKQIRWAVAKNTTNEEIIFSLKNDSEALVRNGVAENPCTPSVVLEELAKDEDIWVRGEVAQNPNTTFEVQEMLAQDQSYYVRSNLASTTNKEILKTLSKDRSLNVLEIVCLNENTPFECIQDIYSKKSKCERIVEAIAKNPNINSEIICEIYNNFPDNESIMAELANNPKTPKRILVILATTGTREVRWMCACHCKYKEILLQMVDVSDEFVLSGFIYNNVAMHDEEIIRKLLKAPNNIIWLESLVHPTYKADLIDADWKMIVNLLKKNLQ